MGASYRQIRHFTWPQGALAYHTKTIHTMACINGYNEMCPPVHPNAKLYSHCPTFSLILIKEDVEPRNLIFQRRWPQDHTASASRTSFIGHYRSGSPSSSGDSFASVNEFPTDLSSACPSAASQSQRQWET